MAGNDLVNGYFANFTAVDSKIKSVPLIDELVPLINESLTLIDESLAVI